MSVISSTLNTKPDNPFFSSVQDERKHRRPVEQNTSAGSQSIRFFGVLAYWSFFFFFSIMPSLKYSESEILEWSSDEVTVAWQLCRLENKEGGRTRSSRRKKARVPRWRSVPSQLPSADMENGWMNRRQADCGKASRLETTVGDVCLSVTFTSRRVRREPRPISLERVCAGIKEASCRCCCCAPCLTKHAFHSPRPCGKSDTRRRWWEGDYMLN